MKWLLVAIAAVGVLALVVLAEADVYVLDEEAVIELTLAEYLGGKGALDSEAQREQARAGLTRFVRELVALEDFRVRVFFGNWYYWSGENPCAQGGARFGALESEGGGWVFVGANGKRRPFSWKGKSIVFHDGFGISGVDYRLVLRRD